jgi:hypothetical protein
MLLPIDLCAHRCIALRSMRGVEVAGRSEPLRRTANSGADSPPGGTPSDGGLHSRAPGVASEGCPSTGCSRHGG